MQDRYPLTITQLRQTMDDMLAMKDQAEAICQLMSAGYGDADPRAIRAGELSGTIQRLIWEIERADVAAMSAVS